MVWNVPAQTSTISVNNFLPTGVALTTDGAAFQVTTSPSTTTITRTLGQDCATCLASDGQTIPKPQFTGGGTATVTLPAGVTTATLTRDTLLVTITNNYNFDPIRPSAAASAARGSMVVAVTSGSTTLGTGTVDGATTAMPAGGSVSLKIPLSGNVAGASGMVIKTTLNSPLGDAVKINAAQTTVVTGATALFFASGASVNLANQNVTSQADTIDLSTVDNTVSNHADGGALVLDITNPFSATGNLSVKLTGGTSPITKTVALTAGSSSSNLSFTKAELQSLFGHQIQLSISGAVTGNAIAVAPGQTVSVGSRLQVNVNVGSSN